MKKICTVFPPSEINLGLNTGGRYTPRARISFSHTPEQFLILKGHSPDRLPSLLWGSFAIRSRRTFLLDTRLCVGLIYVFRTSLFLWRPSSKAHWPVGHCPWLGCLSAAGFGLLGVLGNAPSCRAGTVSSRATKNNLEGSGRSAPQPLWRSRPLSA